MALKALKNQIMSWVDHYQMEKTRSYFGYLDSGVALDEKIITKMLKMMKSLPIERCCKKDFSFLQVPLIFRAGERDTFDRLSDEFFKDLKPRELAAWELILEKIQNSSFECTSVWLPLVVKHRVEKEREQLVLSTQPNASYDQPNRSKRTVSRL